MICRPKYYFKKDLKMDFLNGHTITYVAEQIGTTPQYLSSILRSIQPVDDYVILELMKILKYNNQELDDIKRKFFIKCE